MEPLKEVGADIFREVEQLIAEGYSREKIEGSLSQMGYSPEQSADIFRMLGQKRAAAAEAKQKQRMFLMAGVAILFIAMLAAVGLLATAT